MSHEFASNLILNCHWSHFSRVIGESTTGPTRTHCMWSSPSLSLSSSFLFRASSSMLSLALVQVSVGISLLHCILTNHTSKYLSLLDLTFLTYTPLLIYWLCKGFLKKITLTLQPRRIQLTFPPCCSNRPRSASFTGSSSSPPSSLSASVSPSRQSLNNAKKSSWLKIQKHSGFWNICKHFWIWVICSSFIC